MDQSIQQESDAASVSLVSARTVYRQLGYTKWERFEGLIKRANHLIQNGISQGVINKSSKLVSIGMGAKREIADYLLDPTAYQLIQTLAASYKLNTSFLIRNETAILTLLQKYCTRKRLAFQFQRR